MTAVSELNHITTATESSHTVNVLTKLEFQFTSTLFDNTDSSFEKNLLALPYDPTKYPCGAWQVVEISHTPADSVLTLEAQGRVTVASGSIRDTENDAV